MYIYFRKIVGIVLVLFLVRLYLVVNFWAQTSFHIVYFERLASGSV